MELSLSLKNNAIPRKLPKRRSIQREALEQKVLIARVKNWHPEIYDYFFAIPNGGKRNAFEANNLKLEGVKAGVSDLFLALPVNGYAGLWLELKQKDKTKAKLTKEQQEWLERMNKVGYATAVAYGCDDAYQKLIGYIQQGESHGTKGIVKDAAGRMGKMGH